MTEMRATVSRVLLTAGIVGLSLNAGHAAGQRAEPQAPAAAPAQSPSLAPYVPTRQDVVDRMLALAQVTKADTVYDLGCGDGRIVITAAQKYGAHGVGVDIDPQRIAEATANAKQAGVESLVQFKLQDAR